MVRPSHWLVAAAALAVTSCRTGDERRQGAPPPVASAKPAACAAGGGKITDAVSAPFFPRLSGGFCLDPNGGDRAIGEGVPPPVADICDLFDGECEIYKGYGVRRVVEARYVDGGGTVATIDVHLSKYATTEGAYAMFTRRVVGDGDPADEATPRPIDLARAGGGVAALGLGNAYLWRGLYLVELTYNDETAAVAGLKAAGEALLPALVAEMAAKIPGAPALPPAAAALPAAGLLPLGIRFITKDLLGVEGVGPGALGYYRDGDKRWRVASSARADADQAKDVLSTLAKLPGATREKYLGDGAVRLMRKDGGIPVEWIFARSGKAVLGVGDEPRVLRAGQTADEHAKVTLAKDEKVDRLKKILPGG